MNNVTGGLLIIIACLISIVITSIVEVRKLRKDLAIAKQLKISDLWLIREKIKLVSPREFERIIEYLFRQCGYQTILTDAGADGGKDIILKKNGKVIFVECKHWKEFKSEDGSSSPKVGRPIAQKLKGAMDYGLDGVTPVNGGMIVSTTSYTNQCREYCEAMDIELFDFNGIMKMVKEVGSTNLYKMLGIPASYEV